MCKCNNLAARSHPGRQSWGIVTAPAIDSNIANSWVLSGGGLTLDLLKGPAARGGREESDVL
jgi:hypothetical protein